MIPHLVYYQLAILVLLSLCVMLPYLWPSPSPGSHPKLAEPASMKPKRKRSNEPKPFAGLTQKPHCELSEQATRETTPPPPVRPNPMLPTNRRPRMVDTSMHFCPHTDCDYRGWLGLHNLRANSHPSSGPWRQFHCLGCNGYFPEHHGTIFHGKQAAVERIVRVLACLAEGLGIRATARVFEVAPNTVLRRGCNPRLRHALYHMARVAMQRDAPVNRVYAAWRAKGQRHGQALRNMATDCCVF